MNFDTIQTGNSDGQAAQSRPLHPTERKVVEAIRNTRRRYALYYIHKQDGAVDLTEVVDQVAAWETFPSTADVPDAKRRSVYASLYQTHLPDLEARGLIRWDRATNRISCQLQHSMIDLLLANDQRTSIRWYRVYFFVAVFAGLVAGLVWAGVGPFEGISLIAVTGAVVLVYAVISAIHWYDVYRWRHRMERMPPDFLVSIDHSAPPQESETETEDDDRR